MGGDHLLNTIQAPLNLYTPKFIPNSKMGGDHLLTMIYTPLNFRNLKWEVITY